MILVQYILIICNYDIGTIHTYNCNYDIGTIHTYNYDIGKIHTYKITRPICKA